MLNESSIFNDMANFFNSKMDGSQIPVSLTSRGQEEVKQEAIEKFYKKLEEMGYNLDELRAILDSNNTMLILSGAGSGKTTALILKIIRDLISGDLINTKVINGVQISTQANVLVSTFLKTGAEELQKSFIDWCRKLNIIGVDMNKIHFRTIHSEVYSALLEMGYKANITTDTGQVMRDIMRTYGLHSVLSNGRNITIDEVADVNCLVSYVRNRLDAKRYVHPLMDEYNIDTLQMDAILKNFRQHKLARGFDDFEDLQETLLGGLQCNPNVVDIIRSRYEYIYVDEFQDTSQLQYEILKYYFSGAKKVLCIGDDDQCLVEGTLVNTDKGIKPIEKVEVGDKVLSGVGRSKADYHEVNHVSKKKIEEEIMVIKTKSGKELRGTKDHISFAKGYNGLEKVKLDKIERDYLEIKGNKEVKIEGLFTDNKFGFIELQNLQLGMCIPIIKDNLVIEDEIVEVNTEFYNGFVYDLSVPTTRNFVANSIVVKNCIYSWRGSDIEIITKKFAEDFNPEIRQLTTNYRCSQNILNAVVPSIEKNNMRRPKDLKAFRPGGEVNVIIDGSVNHLMSEVKEDLARGETVGIISRTNADLLIPAILLELDERDITFGLSKSVSLDNRLPKQVFGLMDLVTKRFTPEFESMLKMFLPKYRHFEVEKLCDVLNINKDKSLFTIPLEDLRHSAPSLFNMLYTLRLNYEVNPKKAYLGLLKILPQEVYNGKSIYAQRARDFIFYIQKIVEEHDMIKEMSLGQLDELFNVVLPQKLNRRKKTDNERLFIKVTTVHEAKGKEWDNVYIWNDIDGCFPSSVGNRELTEDEFEEERRVHYIAWTRPKKKLTVYTRSDRESGFLAECDLTHANVVEVNGLKSKTQGVSDNRETQVFQKKEKQVEKTFEDLVDDYYKKYNHFTWLSKSEGLNLDICDTRLGGKDKVIEELKKRGVDLYPHDMVELAITDAFAELACVYLR